jgi:hypothetical protein
MFIFGIDVAGMENSPVYSSIVGYVFMKLFGWAIYNRENERGTKVQPSQMRESLRGFCGIYV